MYTMGGHLVCLLLLALWGTVTAAQVAPQRFEADKFLDMLGRSFDPQVAYMDLMAALNKRLKQESANNNTAASSPVDPGASNPNTMVETGGNCPNAPEKLGASITYTSESKNVGSRAFYQCDPGYNGRSLFVQCMNGGVWSTPSGWEGCKPVDCGSTPPTIINADIAYTTTTLGSMATYTCQPGYKLDNPAANVTCLDTGYWDTPTFTCEKITLPQLDTSNLAALGALFGGGGTTGANTNQNPMMVALLKSMQGMPGFPNSPPTSPTPPPTTTPKPTLAGRVQMGGFQLPSHLQSLLPNGLSNTQGMRPQDLMALASVGLGTANSATAPRDISQLLSSMNPMSIFGPSMGLGGPSTGTTGAAGGTGAALPPDPEKMAEQREEMMMRAMMANAMKSMMQPRTPTNGTTTAQTSNPAMEMMTLMALQSGLSGGGAAGGGSGASGGLDPMAMMLGGMNPAMLGLGGSGGMGAGGLFGGLFGGA